MTKMVNDGEKALFVAKMAVNHEKYEIRIIRKIFLIFFFLMWWRFLGMQLITSSDESDIF